MALDNFVLQNTNPMEAYLQGAGGIQTLQNNNQVMQARQLAQQQAEAAQSAALQKQKMQMDLYNTTDPLLLAKKTAAYQLAHPDDYKAVEASSKTLSDQQRKSVQGITAQVTSAVSSGRKELGQQVLDDYVKGLENSGAPDDQIAGAKFFQKQYSHDPQAAITAMNLGARALDPESYDANNKVAQETSDLVAKRPLEAAKTTAETVKIYSDIDARRDENRIKAMEAAASRETNDLKRQELQLKIDEAKQTLADKKAEQTATGEGAAATFDNTISTINNVMTHPGLAATVGKSSMLPTIPGSASSDFQAILETLKSQQFLASVKAMKGAGALSDAEGAKLTNAISNLDVKQSEPAFRKNLQSAMDIVTAAKARSAKQYAQPKAPFDAQKASYGEWVTK